jgi:hypothetical protein
MIRSWLFHLAPVLLKTPKGVRMKHRVDRDSKLFLEAGAEAASPPLFGRHDLSQRACPRCNGLLVSTFCMDLLDETGHIGFGALRCVACGCVVDALILRNRLQPPVPRRQRVRQRKVMSIGYRRDLSSF